MQNRHNFSVSKYDQLPISAQLVYMQNWANGGKLEKMKRESESVCVNEMKAKKGIASAIKRPNDVPYTQRIKWLKIRRFKTLAATHREHAKQKHVNKHYYVWGEENKVA